MKPDRLPLTALIGLGLCLISTAIAHAEPYDLLQFRLGMTLEEFKKNDNPNSAGKAAPYCTSEYLISFLDDTFPSMMNPEAGLGVVLCEFHVREDYGTGTKNWDEFRFFIVSNAYPVSFYFIDDKNGTMRLFWMLYAFNNLFWDRFVDAHINKFGTPVKEESETVQNQLGALFNNLILHWDNGDSWAYLAQRSTRVDEGTAAYGHSALWDRYLERKAEHAQKATGNL